MPLSSQALRSGWKEHILLYLSAGTPRSWRQNLHPFHRGLPCKDLFLSVINHPSPTFSEVPFTFAFSSHICRHLFLLRKDPFSPEALFITLLPIFKKTFCGYDYTPRSSRCALLPNNRCTLIYSCLSS